MRWVLDNLQLIGAAASSHLGLALPAIVASFLLALPLGWLANRFRWSRFALLTAASVLYAIPVAAAADHAAAVAGHLGARPGRT